MYNKSNVVFIWCLLPESNQQLNRRIHFSILVPAMRFELMIPNRKSGDLTACRCRHIGRRPRESNPVSSDYEPEMVNPFHSPAIFLRFMCSSVSMVNNTLRTFHSFIWMTASFSLRLKLANWSGLSGRKRILVVRETART